MDVDNIYNKTFTLVQKALDLCKVKHNLIASNIANAETPQYKALKVKFDEELKFLRSGMGEDNLCKTNPKHLPFHDSINPTSTEHHGMFISIDSNTVDLEREMTKLSKNTLFYNTLTQMLAKKIGILKYAIREGGK
ncbi:MAG: flagellar basal body rod protein FlgB [Thermodesulfobacteriota bacterium]|nr:flagellar basal body rod protein FlgB [Thermodesulfobacteriota bacterium]